jgi:hypothetical protein
MYKHHEESIEIMKDYFEKKGAVALILGGSVAKGNERPDSDLDGMVIVTDEVYEELDQRKATTDYIPGYCTYEGGYFDIKYMTKSYLKDLVNKGSEPARSGFRSSKILFSHDKEIGEILPRIPVFQTQEKDVKLLSFYSDFWLNYYYFLKSCNIDGYMKMRTVAEIIYALYRIILQEAEILFDCNRRLEKQVEAISDDTAQLVLIGHKLEISQTVEDADAFVNKFFEISTYKAPSDAAVVFTTYSKDFQEWWREYRPNINEW